MSVAVLHDEFVAPLAGAWIEMMAQSTGEKLKRVAPLAGAWIEIVEINEADQEAVVAPLAGAWIEIRDQERSQRDI